MNVRDDKDRLIDLALRVSDGRAIDWEHELAESPGVRDTILGLERLAEVAAPVANVAHDAGDAALFAWGPLRVLRRLGQGSFGEVFAAWDPALQREVALKLRREAAGSTGSLAWLAEARHLARVRHPNVLTVHGADVHDGRAGMWTELLEGRTLEDSLAATGPLGAREAALIGLDLCAALAAVHGAGLVHGDVKPSNVMRVGVTSGEAGASGRIVLMDFGAAHDGAGVMLGTPLAAAPELLRGEPASPRSDLYSLGVLLYRLVTGRHPVEARTAEELRARHAEGARTRLRDARPDLPRSYVDAVERALESDPARRFESAAGFERALADVVAPAAAPARPGRAIGNAAWVLGALVMAVVLYVAFARPPAVVRTPATDASRATNPAGPGATAPGAPVPAPAAPALAPRVEASLLRVSAGESRRLSDGDPIAPGDQLALEIRVEPAAYVYVLNADATGNVHALFPLAESAVTNPLATGETHRLPGHDRAGTVNWQVTSSGGEEQFLIAAAAAPVPELEAVLASVSAAREGAGVVYPSPAAEADGRLRGVGGVTRAPGAPPSSTALAGLASRIGAPGRAVWYRILTLENP